jgi:hypothetical protein
MHSMLFKLMHYFCQRFFALKKHKPMKSPLTKRFGKKKPLIKSDTPI